MATFQGGPQVLGTAQTGNVNTAGGQYTAASDASRTPAVVITSTVGATPTVTANIQGSVDGTNWYNIPYSLVGVVNSYGVGAITITTAVTTVYQLQGLQAAQYIRVAYTANTNVTLTTTLYA